MALQPSLKLRAKTGLAITPQLRQAIGLLRLNNIEFSEMLQAEAERNPLLEVQLPAPLGDLATTSLETTAEAAQPENMRGQLLSDIGTHPDTSPHICDIAKMLVFELDERGYLPVPLFELADRYQVTTQEVEEALNILQSCDPPGLGARDLKECFAFQLKRRGLLTSHFEELLEHMHWLAQSDGEARLAQHLQLSEDIVARMVVVLRDLDPHPGRFLEETPAQLRTADISITVTAENRILVEANGNTLPKLSLLPLPELADQEAHQFAKGFRESAEALIRAAEQRLATMLKIGEALAHEQRAYFYDGIAALRPLTMAKLAKTAGVHPSTVSRICATRAVETPHGLRPMRFFFSAGLGAENTIAARVVMERIREIVADEDFKKPISDKGLTENLAQEGINVARRTVAKYRETMGIPSSVMRRRLAGSMIR